MTYSDYIDTPSGMRQKVLETTVHKDYAAKYRAIDHQVRQLAIARLRLLEAMPTNQGTLLDYGAGTFRFVEAARWSGWPAYGWDIQDARKCEDFHYKLDPCELRSAWEVVCFHDSLEHLADPAGVIGALNPSWLFISVPWCHYPSDETWFMVWHHRWPGEHLWHWNRASLGLFLDALGYQEVVTGAFEDHWRSSHHPPLPNILTGIYRKTKSRE